MTTAADPSITLALARSLWAAGMDAGHGYAPESSDPETAARALGSVLLQPVTGEDVWVVRTPAGQIVVVGGTQAWAVDITEALAGEADGGARCPGEFHSTEVTGVYRCDLEAGHDGPCHDYTGSGTIGYWLPVQQ